MASRGEYNNVEIMEPDAASFQKQVLLLLVIPKISVLDFGILGKKCSVINFGFSHVQSLMIVGFCYRLAVRSLSIGWLKENDHG